MLTESDIYGIECAVRRALAKHDDMLADQKPTKVVPGAVHSLTSVESVRIEELGGNRAVTLEAALILQLYDRAVREKIAQETLAPRQDPAYESARRIWCNGPILESLGPQQAVDRMADMIRISYIPAPQGP